MEYILKQYDIPLLKFQAETGSSDPKIEILWCNKEKEYLLPMDIELTSEGLNRWLRHRTIPKNRAYVHSLLSKCGLNTNRPLSIIHVCKGLSLNDSYWVEEAGNQATFDNVNLYDNPFSNTLAALAFTGYGSSPRSFIQSSPEFTTNGMLPKCWRRINGRIYLYKGGTEGASNLGFEPYSEFYAAQVAQAMGINFISYNLSRWKGRLCSTCELFTSKDISFVPVGRIVTKGGMPAVQSYYENLGTLFVDALNEMLLFDAIICNTDRHFGNFGFLIDNHINQIIAPAPLFDHGNSLFNFAGRDAWENDTTLETYVSTLVPCMYDGFIGTAKAHIQQKQREQLRRLFTFNFQRHSRYNLPAKRLRMIERQIQKRARLLLDD